MKNVMKMLFAAIIVTAPGMNAVADEQEGDNIEVIADVTSPLEITGVNDMIFGNVAPGVDKVIGVIDNVLEGTVGGNTEQTGTFDIIKGANTQVSFTLNLPPTLQRVGESETMPINFLNSDDNHLGQWVVGAANTSFTPESTSYNTAQTGGDIEGGFAATTIQLRLGGRVMPADGQEAGQYRGEIVLTGIYN